MMHRRFTVTKTTTGTTNHAALRPSGAQQQSTVTAVTQQNVWIRAEPTPVGFSGRRHLPRMSTPRYLVGFRVKK